MRRSRYFENSCLLILLLAYTLPNGAGAQGGSTGSKRKVAMGAGSLPMVAPHMVQTSRLSNLRPNSIGVSSRPVSRVKSAEIKKLVKSSYPSGPYERGLYYKQKGQLDDALIEFIHAAQINPRDTRAFFEQAKIFQARGLNKMARSALEQALAFEPSNGQFRSQLVQLHFNSGNLIGAASEVGKLFNLNQNKKSAKKNNVSEQTFASAPNAAAQIASGQTPLPSTNNDASSAWLNSAVATDTGRSASASNPSLDDVLSSVGSASETKKSEQQAVKEAEIASATAPPLSVAQILNSVATVKTNQSAASEKTKPEKPSISPGVAEIIDRVGKSEVQKPEAQKSDENASIFDRANSMFSWAREKVQSLTEKPATKAEEAPAAAKPSKAASVISWAKEKIPFSPTLRHEKSSSELSEEKAVADKAERANAGKLARAVAVASWAKEKIPFAHGKDSSSQPAPVPVTKENRDFFGAFKSMRDKVEASLHLKPANDPVKAAIQSAQGQSSPAINLQDAKDPDKKLSPELAKQALKAFQDSQGGKKNGNKNVVVNNVAPQEVPNADSKSNLPPEIAKLLEGKFSGPTVITSSNSPEEAAAKAKVKSDDLVKQVLASVPNLPAEKEAARPEASGPKYGLLQNNALKHVGVTQPVATEDDPGSGIMGLISKELKQAGKTIASLIPSINWSLPSLPNFPSKSKDESAASIVANVPAQDFIDNSTNPRTPQVPVPDAVAALTSSHGVMAVPASESVPAEAVNTESAPAQPEAAKPAIVPLDVSRILSRISSASPSAPKLTASNPIAPSLSTMMPMAANPIQDYNALIPQAIPASASAQGAALPTRGAQGINPANSANLMPQSAPQASVAPDFMQNALPPVVQQAIEQAQPLLKPAFNAANQLAQAIAPMVIPHAESQAPQPVASVNQELAPNLIPTPVSKDMANYYRDLQKYYQHAPMPDNVQSPEPAPLSAGPARRLIDVQQSKSGAFTYMKPVIDTDRNYLLGAKQVRTIQPLPGKPMQPKAAVPEDPITKRMRYLIEHGTGTLRAGEAFMFSEETGEGTLFLRDGSCEKRKLQDSQDAEKVMRARRPDIISPKDLQYSLSLLGKLLPPQQNNDPAQQNQLNGPTLDQLMSQMNQSGQGFWGWMKKSLNLK